VDELHVRSPVQPARRFALVVAQRVEVIGLVQKTLDRRARDDGIGRRQQHRLAQLMVQGRTLTASPLLPSKLASPRMNLRCSAKSASACARWPAPTILTAIQPPVQALIWRPPVSFLEARVHLWRAVVLPGPMQATGSRSMLPNHRRGRTVWYGTCGRNRRRDRRRTPRRSRG